jgi:hypothetical protein
VSGSDRDEVSGGGRDGAKVRQIALLLVGVGLLVALFPLSVSAAGQLMTIVDPLNSNKARVGVQGKLWVSDGDGSMTVDGSTTEAPATRSVTLVATTTTTCTAAYTVPAGSDLVIRSALAHYRNAGAGATSSWYLLVGEGCGAALAEGYNDSPSGAVRTIPQTFEPGIIVKSGSRLASYGSNNQGFVRFYGYLVPSSSAISPTTRGVP